MTDLDLVLTTRSCPCCGAIVYVALTGSGKNVNVGDLPDDGSQQHLDWHKRTGTL